MDFYLRAVWQEILGSSVDFLPEFISGILIMSLFYFASRVTNIVFIKITPKNDNGKASVINLVSQISRSAIIIFGVITMLGTWGVNVSAIVAGLGLTGFALGFALKDTLASLLAGVLILIYRPFSLNDRISVCGAEGEVISIDMRYTTIKAAHETHLVPNSKLLSEKVTILG